LQTHSLKYWHSLFCNVQCSSMKIPDPSGAAALNWTNSCSGTTELNHQRRPTKAAATYRNETHETFRNDSVLPLAQQTTSPINCLHFT
jgi:hypothetical protein